LTLFDSPLFRDPKLNPDLSKLSEKITTFSFVAVRDTRFYLYTRKNARQELRMNVESLKNSNWDKNIMTRFIFHGFLGDSNSNVNLKVRKALLELGNYNVVGENYLLTNTNAKKII
jgi:Lipase